MSRARRPGEVADVNGVKIVGFTNVAGPARGLGLGALCQEPADLPRNPDRQERQEARGQLGRRDRQGHRAHPRRRRDPSEFHAEDCAVMPKTRSRTTRCSDVAQQGAPRHDRNRPRRRRSVRVPALDLRAGGVRRLLRGLVGDAGAAHAADVGDQRDLLGDRGRRAARGRRRRSSPTTRAASGRARSASSRWCSPRSTSSAASWSPSACWRCTRRKRSEARAMNANIAALLYLVAGVLFILALRGLSSPETSRRGNMFGMIGMAIAIGTTLAAHPPAGTGAWMLVVARHRARRRHRRGDRAPRADDLDAGAGRGLPFAGRHGGGAGRGRRVLCAGGVRHRHASATSTRRAWSRCRSASPSAPSPSPAR